MGEKNKKNRPSISQPTKIALWAAAAGRCTFCNRLVLENEDLGELVPIGELAHNVGWDKTSPRGQSPLSREERTATTNLLLLCRTCHAPIDQGGVVGRYTVDNLARLKAEHESRIRMVTAIGGDRTALVVRMVGQIRGTPPELTYDTVQAATLAAGCFPQVLPGHYRSAVELDLRELGEGPPEMYRLGAQRIDNLGERIQGALLRTEVQRLAVFGFARIPLLVHLGARLDDKVAALVFQRQRNDQTNAWTWPDAPRPTPRFVIDRQDCAVADRPVLLLNLSGTIPLTDLPHEVAGYGPVYTLRPESLAVAGPTIIDSPAALAALEQTLRDFLASLEIRHGHIATLPIFGAVPVSAAITLGRVLMPQVSPALHVFDRGQDGTFFLALEVTK